MIGRVLAVVMVIGLWASLLFGVGREIRREWFR